MDNIEKILENSTSYFSNLKSQVQSLFKGVMGEIGEVTTFAGYDIGLPFEDKDYSTYEERCKACNDIPVGVLDQGMFQATQLDSDRYKEIQDFLDKNRNIISEINFFMLSSSLEDSISPVLDVFPIVNLYHSCLGITFVDKNKKIIRSAVLQLNFGAIDGVYDAFTRFLAPQFCMNTIKNPDGTSKNPTTFTNDEFTKNMFIDYSKSIPSLLFSFNETENYVTEKLVKSMACVNVANLSSAPPVPYKNFINQNITCQQLYNSYNEQRNGIFKKYQGTADGTIFCLNDFGPSIFTSQGGTILNFATLKNVDKMKTWVDWCFVNYGSCSKSLVKNNLTFYATMGVDKVTPINQLNKCQIENELKKPNIISTDNGFIREMRGRVSHCNIILAVNITLIDQLSKNDNDWIVYTDWENKELQETNKYMLNPIMINLPVANFPENWENGVSIKELNTNPLYKEDKARFYKLWYFAKIFVQGFFNQALQTGLSQTNNTIVAESSLDVILLIFKYIAYVFGSNILATIAKGIAPSAAVKLNQGKLIMTTLLFLYVIIKFELFDNFYWATGQSLLNENGDFNLLFTDQYPTIWKIPLNTENKNILTAYIESIFQKKCNTSLETAGQIYTELEQNKSYGIYYLNRMSHSIPNNKFFLWFPGVKPINDCSNGYLKGRPGITYVPDIKYNLVKPNNSNSLNRGLEDAKKSTNNNFKYIMLILIIILALIIILGVFYYLNNKDNI